MQKNTIDYDWRNHQFEHNTALEECYISCNFYMATMNGVRFTGEFINCLFTAAEFRFARFVGASFKNCKFVGANFKDSAIRMCTFTNCDFAGATFENTSGTTTCHFDRDCRGLFETKGDIEVETQFSADGGSFNVFPKSLRNLYSLAVDSKTSAHGGKVVPWDDDEEDEDERGDCYDDDDDGESSYSDDSDPLVEPEKLSEVSHYRSPPSKILKSDEMSKKDKEDSKDDWDEEDYYACGWYNWISPSKEKHRYGYGTNAVLECTNIEEFRKWKT